MSISSSIRGVPSVLAEALIASGAFTYLYDLDGIEGTHDVGLMP